MYTKRLSLEELRIGTFLYPERAYWKPTTRSECENGIRPCPYVSCRFNLYLDITPRGSVLLNFPEKEPWDMDPSKSCALDIAHGMTLEEIGVAFNVTRERIRQLESQGLKNLLTAAKPLNT